MWKNNNAGTGTSVEDSGETAWMRILARVIAGHLNGG